jgi:pectinesterase
MQPAEAASQFTDFAMMGCDMRRLGDLAIALSLLTGIAAAENAPATKPAAEAKAAARPTAPKWKKVLPDLPPGVSVSTTEIAKYPEHTVELIIYVPDKPGTYPAILDIHGGGWSQRQIESDRPMMERLATRGFVTALVSYRLSTEAPYPAALTDCKSAVRYLRAHAAKYRLDPNRIGVMGGSAGGHLSGLLAMTCGLSDFEGDGPNREVSSGVQAAIVMAATQDMVAANKGKTTPNAVTFFGGSCAEKPDVYRQASPITHVRAGVPPTIFIEGEKDTLKVGRAEMMEKLRSLGIDTDVYTLAGAPHPFWMSQPWLDETVDIATRFFKKHLGEPTAEK